MGTPSDRFSGLSPLQRAYLAVEEMQAKLDTAERLRTEPIAIVGIGCRFPGGADSPAELWPLLRGGFDAITEVPADRWDIDAYYDPDPNKPGKMCTRWGGFLKGVDLFDTRFFGISPREATLMDPQQRLLLEVTSEALEDAGLPESSFAGSRTGVFMGIYNTDYAQFQHQDEAYAAMGNSLGIGVGRLSYTFDLQGPSMLVDTLCSSSLVAISLACHSLRRRECNLALAGGVNLILSPLGTILSSRLMALAPDGRCKTFDARANGYVRSEGCGVVVLKRLSEALAEGDPIWAVVRGSAVNQDGRSTALTAPNVLAQQAVIRQALEDGGVVPEQVSYIEAHGTGTALGDPIEIEGLRAVYGKPRADGSPCAIGSIKSNLGHTEAASGIAGFIKAVLALKHREIPPHLHLRELNPRIDLEGTPFVIPTELRPWPAREHRRFAAVSAFGLSGTNAHVVLEEAPANAPLTASGDTGRVYVLPLSARSPEALRSLAEAFRVRLGGTPLPDLCYTASVRRSHREERLAVVGATAEELQAGLDSFIERGQAAACRRTKLAFVFSGYGGQYAGMGRELLQQEPVFRKAIEQCDGALRSHVDWSLVELLTNDDAEWQKEIGRVQPALFGLQVGLAAMWRSWGIRPNSVIGHSFGEVAAAHVAGVLTLDDAAQIICRRSSLLQGIQGHGSTLLVDLPQEDARRAIAGKKNIAVAASNGPRTTVIAGDSDAISGLATEIQGQGIYCRIVTDVAAHSEQTERLGPAMRAALNGVTAQPGSFGFYSSLQGGLWPGEQCGAAYWVENLQRPVQFWRAFERMVKDGHRIFVEVGPHPVLAASMADGLKALGVEGVIQASLRRGEPERRSLLETLGALYEQRQQVTWKALYPEGGSHVSLPTYPWQRERFWVEAPEKNARGLPHLRQNSAGAGHAVLGERREFSAQPDAFVWEFEPGLETWPYLADHRVEGMVVTPAAAFIELALAGAQTLREGRHTLEQIRFQQMLVIPEDGRVVVQLVISGETFQFASRRSREVGWTVHARGVVRLGQPESSPSNVALSEIRERCRERISGSDYYAALAAGGLIYGPAFQGVTEIWRGEGEALARLQAPAAIAGPEGVYPLHPALLDSCFQTFAAAMPSGASDGGGVYLPVGVGGIDHLRAPAGEFWVHALLSPESNQENNHEKVTGDLRAFGPGGELLFEVRGFAVQRLALANAGADPAAGWLYASVWRRKERDEKTPATLPGTTLIVAADSLGQSLSVGQGLRDALTAKGERCVLVRPGAVRESLRPPLDRVVYLCTEQESGDDPAARSQALATDVLHLVQALAQTGWRDAPRLWLVTRGAQHVVDSDGVTGLGQAPLWGFAKTLALEHPEFACGRIDLSSAPLDGEAAMLADELCSGDKEDQIALRHDGRFVERLVRWPESAAPDAPKALAPAGERAFRLETTKPGVLDHLTLRATPRRLPAAGEVEIEVHAAGLNFLDVLSAMGLRPGGDGPIVLGGECAGIVSAVGAGVHGLKVGHAVIAIAPFSFGRFVITKADFAVRKPEQLSHEEAATIPVVFLTAYYALHELGRLRKGERVLIHSASGGTGLAAVQLAHLAGAEIFATAGSQEKREFLRSLGIRHVMDSRSLAFADEVMTLTGGQGVDVVLNSLTGDAIERGVGVLASEGRFLEIGKKDIYQDHRLGLFPFRNNLSYFAIDLAGLALRRPEYVAALFRELVSRFSEGQLRPLPLRAFDISEAAVAFHTMAQARHIGKIVLTLKAERNLVDREPDRGSGADQEVRPTHSSSTLVEPAGGEAAAIGSDATYLITGGLGGVGLVIAEWLVEQGARHLALIGRRPPSPAAEAKLALLRQRGARIEVIQADVSQLDSLTPALRYVDAHMPPLRGVMNAAGVLADGTLTRLTEDSFATVFAPKVAGAWNLHTLTRRYPLDFFVMFSSAASVLGSPGQANYAAANAFLDGLAHYRRAQGHPALSINWGPWAEVGLAAAQENRGERLAAMGMASIAPRQGAAVLGRLRQQDVTQMTVMPFRLRHWRQLAPAAAELPLFEELLQDDGAEQDGRQASAKMRAALVAAEPGTRRALLEQHLTEQIARVLRTSSARITRDTPFNSLGMDSLMGLELRNRLESSLGVSLQATLVWSHPTIEALVPHLAAKAGVPLEDSAAVSVAVAEPQEPPAIDELSDGDASALLAEKLAALDEEYRS